MSNLSRSFRVIDGPSKARLALVLFHANELKKKTVEFKLWTVSIKELRGYKKEGKAESDLPDVFKQYREFEVDKVQRGSHLTGNFVVSVFFPGDEYRADIHFDTHTREGRLIKTEQVEGVSPHA